MSRIESINEIDYEIYKMGDDKLYMRVFRIGDLAYYDSFSGLIPVKTLQLQNCGAILLKVTADRGSYYRGDKIISSHAYVVPRSMVRIKSGQYMINPNYVWSI